MKGNTVHDADASPSRKARTNDLLLQLKNNPSDNIWTQFFSRYSPFVFAFAISRGVRFCDAHDIVQETLRVVVGKITSAPDLNQREFEHWLRAVARHKICDLFRRYQLSERYEPESKNWTEDSCVTDKQQRLFVAVDLFIEELRKQSTDSDFAAFSMCVMFGEAPDRAAQLLHKTKRAVYVSVSKVKCLARSQAEHFIGLQTDEPN